jgi:uncharacterized membrane protein
MRTLPASLLPIAGVLWLIVLTTAPLALHHDATALPAIGVYRACSVVCHQRAERSFRIASVQMPVCGRCFGLYASAALGALSAWTLARRRAAPTASIVRIVLLAAALPLLISVGLEWFGLIRGSNVSRFLSALPLGAAAGWLLQQVAAERRQESCVIIP